MAFVRKTWKNRASEFINRRMLTKEDGTTELVTVERNEGTISEEGDAFNADNMNDLEERVYEAFFEVLAQLTAGDNALFRFGINENGEYGYIVADSEGADTVIPFSGKWKKDIIDALQNTNLGLTYDSTWPEIVAGLNQQFPETLNILAYLGVSSIYKSGDASYTSKEFPITNFNTLTVTCGYGQSGGGGSYSCNLVTTSGTVSLLGTKTIDVSKYTGDAYITIKTTKQSMSGWDPSKPYDEWGENNSHWTSNGYVNLTKALLSV